MAQEPKKKHSKARKRTRRASIKLSHIGLVNCENCGTARIPHQACPSCGFYDGKKVLSKVKVQVTKA